MPDIHDIIDRMEKAGESPDAIRAVVQHHNATNAAPTGTVSEDEPTTWWGGVKKSLLGGEALGAGLKGALGFAKGAIADIPSSISSAASGALDAIASPIDTLTNLPGNLAKMGSAIAETTSRAGSDPEAFGRMMGNITGQPAVMAGVTAAIPHIPAAAGYMLEKTGLDAPIAKGLQAGGQFVSDYKPFTKMIPSTFQPEIVADAQNYLGGKLRDLGTSMAERPNGSLAPGEFDLPPARKYDAVPVKDAEITSEPSPTKNPNWYTQTDTGETVPSGYLGPATDIQLGPENYPSSQTIPGRPIAPEPPPMPPGPKLLGTSLDLPPTGKPPIGTGPFDMPSSPVHGDVPLSIRNAVSGPNEMQDLAAQYSMNEGRMPSSNLQTLARNIAGPEDNMMDFINQFEKSNPNLKMSLGDDISTNASGESAASQEALSRQAGMKSRGEKFVVYDRAGNARPLIGPDAVDYNPAKGETYGIEDSEGNFRTLTDNGGNPNRLISGTAERLNQPGGINGQSFYEKLKMEAKRYNIPVEDYIKKLRTQGSDDFRKTVFPRPKVRKSTILK